MQKTIFFHEYIFSKFNYITHNSPSVARAHQLITKVIYILFSFSSGLEFLSVNHNSIYENSKLNILKNIKPLSEILNN